MTLIYLKDCVNICTCVYVSVRLGARVGPWVRARVRVCVRDLEERITAFSNYHSDTNGSLRGVYRLLFVKSVFTY